VNPLAGLKVLDLTQRLPGPLAGHLLAELGAEVTKVEDSSSGDPFRGPQMRGPLANFRGWYRSLQAKKKLLELDLRAKSAFETLAPLVRETDIVLTTLGDKAIQQLGLASASVLIKVRAQREHGHGLHDLNALALSGLLPLHLEKSERSWLAPPFLPVAGISFGQQIALKALAFLRQAQQEQKPIIAELYLLEELQTVMRFAWPREALEHGQYKFLHNGAFPCYCLYRTKDGDWLAVAAVEEDFWSAFDKLLDLRVTLDERFSTDAKIFDRVAQVIQTRTTAELKTLLAGKELCVSLVKATPEEQV